VSQAWLKSTQCAKLQASSSGVTDENLLLGFSCCWVSFSVLRFPLFGFITSADTNIRRISWSFFGMGSNQHKA
jgi:hypothetical protein